MRKGSREDFEQLGKELVELLTQRGLGAISKRDLDGLLLYLIQKHLGWARLSNQELSIRLRLPVPKVKSLRYEGALRFAPDLPAEFEQCLRRLLRSAHFDAGEERVRFIIEDYATRYILEEELKKRGTLAAWEFNDEGVSVPVAALSSLLAAQFAGAALDQAMQRLGISEPSALGKAIEDILTEVADVAKHSPPGQLVKILDKTARKIPAAKALLTLLLPTG